jgi:hypothetical protein
MNKKSKTDQYELKELLKKQDCEEISKKLQIKTYIALMSLSRGVLDISVETHVIDKLRAQSRIMLLIEDAYSNKNLLLFVQIDLLLSNFTWKELYNIDNGLRMYRDLANRILQETR